MTFNSPLLKQMLKQKRISQLDLAEKTGKDKRTVSRWVHGQSVPKERDRQKIAVVLGCDPRVFDADLAQEAGVPIHAKITVASHNAFEILNRRFGVSQKQIIELAPVLFTIVAERAMQVPLEDRVRPEPGKLPYFDQSSEQGNGFVFDEQAVQAQKCFGLSAGSNEHAVTRNLFEEAMSRILRDLVTRPNMALPEDSAEPGTAPTAIGFNPWLDEIAGLCENDPELIEALTQGRVRLADIIGAERKDKAEVVALLRSELKSYRDESLRKLREWEADYVKRFPDEASEYDALVMKHCHPDGWYPEDYTAAQRARSKAEPWLEDRHLDLSTLPGFGANRERSLSNLFWEMEDPVYQRFWRLRHHRENSKRKFEGASK